MAAVRIPGPQCLLDRAELLDSGTMCRARSPRPGVFGGKYSEQFTSTTSIEDLMCLMPRLVGGSVLGGVKVDRFSAKLLNLSVAGSTLLKSVEDLRLKPYDDQTDDEISAWVKGATIGYGHLISQVEWPLYKDGISQPQADVLFGNDALPFVQLAQKCITAALTQNEFDALVILAFNIGPTFADSSVVKLVNDANAQTGFASLEAAWKVWNKSQGKVMKGLINRRNCEWGIYTQGVYERW